MVANRMYTPECRESADMAVLVRALCAILFSCDKRRNAVVECVTCDVNRTEGRTITIHINGGA